MTIQRPILKLKSRTPEGYDYKNEEVVNADGNKYPSKEEANSHLEHLFWKQDLEAMDLMKLENQTPVEIDNEVNNYLYGLEEDLKQDYFNHERFYYAYKEAQSYFHSEDFEKDLAKDLMCVKTEADLARLEDHMEANPSHTFKKNPDGTGTMIKHSSAGDQTEFDYAFMYYQPVLITDHIYDLITEFDLEDNNQTRWCIAMIQRHEEGRQHKTQEDMFRAVKEAVRDMITIDVLEKNGIGKGNGILELRAAAEAIETTERGGK